MRVNVDSITTGISALQLAHAVQVMLTRQQIILGRDHAMTSVGICASVVSGAKILVRDRLLKVPDTTTLGCGYP